jgi:putative Mn2+ efflux pump MntP
MKKLIAYLLIVLLTLPVLAFAHPGHGSTDGYTIIHYLVEPAHVVFQVIIIVLVAYIVKLKQKEKNQKN